MLSGAGGFTLNGPGTLVLSNAANTYTGGTTLAAGTPSVGADGDLGAVANTVTMNGGALATTGTFTSARTVMVGAGGGAFLPGIGTTLTLSGTMNGTGALALTGAGTVLLTGTAGGATGTFTVTSGTLEVGSAATPGVTYGGNVVVQGGGTLAGHGTVGGTVTSSGNVAPGGTIGTLTVSGDYAQAAGGTLTLETNPATASELVVTGSASLAGTLALTLDAGTYVAATEYTLVTAAGGVTGTFGTLTLSGASLGALTPELTYQANAVELTLLPPVCSGSPVLDCEVSPNSSAQWSTQITATTVNVNTQNPNNGTLVLTTTNNQQTTTDVIAGTLSVSDPGNLGSATGALTLGGMQTGGGATNGTLLMTAGSLGGEVRPRRPGGTLLVAPGKSARCPGRLSTPPD